MYYILNETDQIIAADDTLLTLCNVTDVSGLSSKVTLGDTTFTSQNEANVTITTNDSEQTFSVSKTSLSSILGHMTLVELDESQESEDTIIGTGELVLDSIDDTEEEKFEPLNLEEEVSFDISTDDSDDDLFEINETVEEESIPEVVDTIDEADEPFDLLGETTENIDLDVTPEEIIEEDGEIVVDIANISQTMGISDEDYTSFLNEYIDTALELEEDLQSDDADTRNGAIMTLSDLSEIMHLPEISNIMGNIHASTPEQQKGYIGSLYTTLSRLTTQSSSNEAVEMELFDSIEAPPKIEDLKVKAEPNPNSFGTIDLSDVKAKHFDFQLEEAANDLSLPVELIEEFVHDFIEQAHIETKKMLEAYEEGDLAKIQAIGHLLKGASSNLRINALSDTLYKIQFCENENGLDDLIKEYWAHFLSFETQINVISN
ncbi:hypothetical protein [Sulfurovum sp.]|uniref:hypothetical protein n=1 Tax=Sulfurovum sp. TaxID=1969726 RepID=UPI002867C855|nr:hypothetical protein [Sulfurovum sp.]